MGGKAILEKESFLKGSQSKNARIARSLRVFRLLTKRKGACWRFVCLRDSRLSACVAWLCVLAELALACSVYVCVCLVNHTLTARLINVSFN